MNMHTPLTTATDSHHWGSTNTQANRSKLLLDRISRIAKEAYPARVLERLGRAASIDIEAR